MTTYLFGRVGRIVLQVLIILSAVFFLFRIAPGDPALLILGPNAGQDQIDLLRQELGLNLPVWQQYVDYLSAAVAGDLGESLSYSQPAVVIVLQHVKATVVLLVSSLSIAVTLGMSAGVMSALMPRSMPARMSLFLWVILLAIPNFWLGMLLVQVFAVNLGWLPAIGSSGLALVLPAFSIAARLVALIARLTRATMLEVVGEDFVRAARARGVSPIRLVFHHILRPALPPVLILIGLQAGYLLGGSVVIENLFSYPGMGSLLLVAVGARDFALVQAITIFYVVGFLFINLLVDVVSSRLDPRIRLAGTT
ncbi:MAG: ABC transporter permease [Actinomycetota bacterium]